jgi:hypothetical protein
MCPGCVKEVYIIEIKNINKKLIYVYYKCKRINWKKTVL